MPLLGALGAPLLQYTSGSLFIARNIGSLDVSDCAPRRSPAFQDPDAVRGKLRGLVLEKEEAQAVLSACHH